MYNSYNQSLSSFKSSNDFISFYFFRSPVKNICNLFLYYYYYCYFMNLHLVKKTYKLALAWITHLTNIKNIYQQLCTYGESCLCSDISFYYIKYQNLRKNKLRAFFIFDPSVGWSLCIWTFPVLNSLSSWTLLSSAHTHALSFLTLLSPHLC